MARGASGGLQEKWVAFTGAVSRLVGLTPVDDGNQQGQGAPAWNPPPPPEATFTPYGQGEKPYTTTGARLDTSAPRRRKAPPPASDQWSSDPRRAQGNVIDNIAWPNPGETGYGGEPDDRPQNSPEGWSVIVYHAHRRVADSQAIITELLEGRMLILDCSDMQNEDTTRLVDMVGGAAFALGGQMYSVAAGCYCAAPAGVDISENEGRRAERGRTDDRKRPEPRRYDGRYDSRARYDERGRADDEERDAYRDSYRSEYRR
ncbi:hypothetical protein FACS1894196_3390 [Clostridia bacterium]|nr:hypothetical protein FACS1894196_3390 [Clostridia bacterium]